MSVEPFPDKSQWDRHTFHRSRERAISHPMCCRMLLGEELPWLD
jgi:hypothetical protein